MPTISRVIIDQQRAGIGIKSTRAWMNINTPHPTMEVEQDIPELEVDHEYPAFELDWVKVQAESGLKRPMELTRTFRDESKQKTLEAIGTIVHDAEFLGDLTQPGIRVGRLQTSKSRNRNQTTVNIALMPKSSPDVEWDKGHINVDWTDPGMNVDWTKDYLIDLEVDDYSVEVFLKDKPYMNITVIQEQIPKNNGNLVDAKR